MIFFLIFIFDQSFTFQFICFLKLLVFGVQMLKLNYYYLLIFKVKVSNENVPMQFMINRITLNLVNNFDIASFMYK